MKRNLSPAMIQRQKQMRHQQLRKECELFRSKIFLLLNRIDNKMSMFQIVSEFGKNVKLENFAVDYRSIRK